MQRQPSLDKTPDILALLDEHVSHLFVGFRSIAFHLKEEKAASSVLAALSKDERVPTSWHSTIKSEHQTCHSTFADKKCFVIKLNQAQVDTLWGKGSYQIMRDMHDVLERDNRNEFLATTGQLASIAKSNRNLYLQLMRLCASNSWNMTMAAFRCQPSDSCKILIDCATTAALHHAISLVNGNKDNAFSVSLVTQPPEVCSLLVNRLTDDVLNPMLSLQNDNGWPFVMHAAWNQSSVVFDAIVKLASPTLLAHAICMRHTGDKQSTIEVAAQYQTPATFDKLLQRVSETSAKELINAFYHKNTDNLFNSFKIIALHQTAKNCEQFLELLDTEQRMTLFKHCKTTIETYHTRFALRALRYKVERESSKKILSNVVLELLSQPDAAHAAKMREEKKSEPAASHEMEALQKFKKGVFVKIIRHDKNDNAHGKFVSHLGNPKYRQVIRNTNGEHKQGFKAQLRPTDEKESKTPVLFTYAGGFPTIMKARTPAERNLHKKQKPPYVLSSKHPVTYVSANLHSGLFGYLADREMIGYAFTVNPDNIRLLMTQDSGTYNRWWYHKDFNTLIANINHRLNILCQSFGDFVKRIDEQPYVVNEALVKLGLQDLFAIIIAKDTPYARKIAIEHRLELSHRFDKDLPILFYDPEYQHAGVYTSAEQRKDFPQFFLAELKKGIEFFLTPKTHNFFLKLSVIDIRIDYQDYTINKALARKILDIINKNEKTPERAFAEILPVVSAPLVIAQSHVVNLG